MLPPQKNASRPPFIILLIIAASIILVQQGKAQAPAYPRVAGYFSVVQPIGTWNKDGFTSNFSGAYTIGFPFGLNLLKSDKFGISFEVAPSIRTEKNVSKVS